MRDFFSQAVPEPHIVLGVLLRPFSLGHNLLLHRIKSPFVNGGSVTVDDLVSAIFICAQTWEDNIAMLRDGCVERKLGPFVWREQREKFLARWFKRAGVFDIRVKSRAFQKYLTEGGLGPLYSYKPSEMRSIDCPDVEIVYITLKERLHLSETEIHNRAWGRCLHDYVTGKAIDGHVRIHSEDRDAMQAAADAFHAAYASN